MINIEKEILYMPQGLKTRVEIINGFGKEELFKTIVVTMIAGMIDIVIYLLLKNTLKSVVFMIVSIAVSIMMLRKDKTNISVFD
jgi:hypothetical protein